MNYGVGVRFTDFISFYKYPMKMKKLVSLRPNYFIFIGYLKTRRGERGSREPPESPLDPPLNCTMAHLLKSLMQIWRPCCHYGDLA